MEFEQPLIEGRLVRRYKRFFAEVLLPDGTAVLAHCANPGSMRTCMPENGRVWLTRHADPRRKLAYTWELVEADGALVCVNTARANRVVAEALAAGVIAELRGFAELRQEVAYGERSRVDFLLTENGEGNARGRACYVEVKSVTLRGGERLAAFPDSVTARGTRHLEELMAMVAAGHRAVMLFCCSRSDAHAMQPADDIDPQYGRMLRRAAAAGVELLAYRCDISVQGMWLRERVPLALPELPAEHAPSTASNPRIKRPPARPPAGGRG